MKLIHYLLQMSYDLHYSPEDWAKKLGITSEEVSLCFSGKNELPFMPFLSLIQEVYPQQYAMRMKIFAAYAKSLGPTDSLLNSMELSSQIGEFDLLSTLIEKCREEKTKLTNEWAELYQIELRKEDLIDNEFLYRTKKATIKSPEMKIMLETLRIYLLHRMEDHLSIDKLLDEALPQIDYLENDYMKLALKMRLHSTTMISCLRLNLIQKVRAIGEDYLQQKKMLECFPIKYAQVIHSYALSFLYDDPDRAIQLLDLSQKILLQIDNPHSEWSQRQNIQTIAFLKNVWGMEQDEPVDLGEKIHYFIARKEFGSAQKLLKHLKKTKPLTEFQTYYWGVAFQDKESLQKAYELFRSNGDFFFAVLPVRALSNLSFQKLRQEAEINQ